MCADLVILAVFRKLQKVRKPYYIKAYGLLRVLQNPQKKESTGFEPARPFNMGSPDFESGALPLCQLSITFHIISSSLAMSKHFMSTSPESFNCSIGLLTIFSSENSCITIIWIHQANRVTTSKNLFQLFRCTYQ